MKNFPKKSVATLSTVIVLSTLTGCLGNTAKEETQIKTEVENSNDFQGFTVENGTSMVVNYYSSGQYSDGNRLKLIIYGEEALLVPSASFYAYPTECIYSLEEYIQLVAGDDVQINYYNPTKEQLSMLEREGKQSNYSKKKELSN